MVGETNDPRPVSRRSVVKTVAAGGLVAAGAATAGSADPLAELRVDPDCECTNEIRCIDRGCSTDSSNFQLQTRECCTCDGETTCENWTDHDFICCTG